MKTNDYHQTGEGFGRLDSMSSLQRRPLMAKDLECVFRVVTAWMKRHVKLCDMVLYAYGCCWEKRNETNLHNFFSLPQVFCSWKLLTRQHKEGNTCPLKQINCVVQLAGLSICVHSPVAALHVQQAAKIMSDLKNSFEIATTTESPRNCDYG